MTNLHFPKSDALIPDKFIAIGELGTSKCVRVFLREYGTQASYQIEAEAYNTCPKNGLWFARFKKLPDGKKYMLWVEDDASNLVASASDLESFQTDEGPVILYPKDSDQVCMKFGSYGTPDSTTSADVQVNGNNHAGTSVPVGPGMFGYSFDTSGDTGSASLEVTDTSGSTAISLTVNNC